MYHFLCPHHVYAIYWNQVGTVYTATSVDNITGCILQRPFIRAGQTVVAYRTMKHPLWRVSARLFSNIHRNIRFQFELAHDHTTLTVISTRKTVAWPIRLLSIAIFPQGFQFDSNRNHADFFLQKKSRWRYLRSYQSSVNSFCQYRPAPYGSNLHRRQTVHNTLLSDLPFSRQKRPTYTNHNSHVFPMSIWRA